MIRSGATGPRLRGFLNLAALDAGRAHANTLCGALHDYVYELEVHIPAAVGHVVRVTDPMPELRATPTNFTYFGHCRFPLLGLHLTVPVRPPLPQRRDAVERLAERQRPSPLQHSQRAGQLPEPMPRARASYSS